jgi:PAS domain S-box-containing protein
MQTKRPPPETFYRTLLESTGDYVWAVNREGRFLYINGLMEKLLGMSNEEAQDKTYGDTVKSASDTEDFLKKVGRVFLGEVVSQEHLSDLNNRLLLRTMSPVRDRSGLIIAVSIISKDITERNHMEKKLREYADDLENLVKERTKEIGFLSDIAASISQAVMVQDNDRKIVFVNRAFEEMYGYRAEEVVGRPSTLLSADFTDGERSHIEMLRALEKNGSWHGEIFRKRKNGEVFVISRWTSYLRDTNGTIIGILSLSADVTEKKEMEKELQQSEEMLNRIFENAPIGIVVADDKGNFTEVNEEQCRLAQASREELLKLSYYRLRDNRIFPFFEKALNGEVCEYIGPHHTTARGLETWRRMVFAPLRDQEGNTIGVVRLTEDITEKKRLEEQLLEKTRLASIGQTALMVGHDLRNPLQTIMINCYLGKKKVESMFADRTIIENLTGFFETVEKQGQYMNKIVSDLQDFGGPLRLNPVETNVFKFIDDVFSTVIVPENIRVSKLIQADFSELIDAQLMRRVFINLITNAIQAMPNGGKLTIVGSRTDRDASISVEDTGMGISEENLGKLFQPLFTTKTKGQGLGLAVCKRIIEAHGGEIAVESKEGEGSTFTIKIPLISEVIQA